MGYNLLKLRHRAEPCQNDLDGQFILLWLAFNAAYVQDLACLNLSETATFYQFVSKTCDLDQNSHNNAVNWRNSFLKFFNSFSKFK
jgi:hypothetical protein